MPLNLFPFDSSASPHPTPLSLSHTIFLLEFPLLDYVTSFRDDTRDHVIITVIVNMKIEIIAALSSRSCWDEMLVRAFFSVCVGLMEALACCLGPMGVLWKVVGKNPIF